MGAREKLKSALARVKELQGVTGREYTSEELSEIDGLKSEIPALRDEVARLDAAADALKSIAGDVDDEEEAGDQLGGGERKSGGAFTRSRGEGVKSFGEMFVESDAYKAFQKSHPSGVGSGSPVNIGRVKVGDMRDYFIGRKAPLTVGDAHLAPVRMPMIDQVERDRLTLLDLIARGRTSGNFEYLQVTGVTRNAAIVAEAQNDQGTDAAGGLKPLSDLATEMADAKVFTYADGYTITNQLLADAPAFATYMNGELNYSLDSVIEDTLLNADGTDGSPKGILHTTGVQEANYASGADPFGPESAMAFVKAVRRAITKVVRLRGGKVDAVVLSPEMDEAIDLLQDANDRFFGGGPFGSGPTTLWGRPRVTSERLTGTDALVGDFKQVALLDREGLSVMAFNQHKDYAQRNLTYVRAELRAAQVIWKPNRLVVVRPGADTEG